jgi:hypothetical protein
MTDFHDPGLLVDEGDWEAPQWKNPSGSFVYAPDVQAFVQTELSGVLDLSRDIESFSISRRVNGVSTFSLSLNNKFRKYDRAVERMDPIVIFLKRTQWLQALAGYTTRVPYETVVPGTVVIEGECTLKRLVYTYWDPYTVRAQRLFPRRIEPGEKKTKDGATAQSMFRILTEVVHWDQDKIHIQKIPDIFIERAAEMALAAKDDVDQRVVSLMREILGIEGVGGGSHRWMRGRNGNDKDDDPLDDFVQGEPRAGAVQTRRDREKKNKNRFENLRNGYLPNDVLHPVGNGQTLRADAAESYLAMKKAALKQGVTIYSTSGYRTYQQQESLVKEKGLYDSVTNPDGAASAGNSNHGDGISMDIGEGREWVNAHGTRWGWINDVSTESWHFTWQGDPRFTGVGLGGGGGGAGSWKSPFTIQYYFPSVTAESNAFTGDRAWLNDESVLKSLGMLSGAALRDFQSAPNGDFVAFFPDKFGWYGKHPVIKIRDIEVVDFKLEISDTPLATHVGVAGDTSKWMGTEPDIHAWITSHGLVTVEMEEVMKLLLGLDPKKNYRYLGADWIMNRFGLRPHRQGAPLIRSRQWEFFLALHTFMQKWSEQFLTTVRFTFMPEIYPGMRIELADHNLAVYVEAVTHQGSRVDGFYTECQVSCPMRRENGKWSLLGLERAPVELPDEGENVDQVGKPVGISAFKDPL